MKNKYTALLWIFLIFTACSTQEPQVNNRNYYDNDYEDPTDSGDYPSYQSPVCSMEYTYNADGTLKKDAYVCVGENYRETLYYNLYEYDSNKVLIKKKIYTVAGLEEIKTPQFICYVLFSGGSEQYFLPDGTVAHSNDCDSF